MISQQVEMEVPLPLPTKSTNPHSANGNAWKEFSRVAFFTKSIELYEIINRATSSTCSGGAAKGCKRSHNDGSSDGTDKDLGTVMCLDESLSQWKQGVPEHLRYESVESSNDEISKRQAVILHIRYEVPTLPVYVLSPANPHSFLQARLLLLRPSLSRFCLEPPAPFAHHDNLRRRVLHECTVLCVSTAQELISILDTHQQHDGTIGLLPAWWYRIYYAFSAATILVVAKLRPELFDAQAVLRSWEQALRVLGAHEKFGRSARRCVAVLEILSDKVFHVAGGVAAGAAGQVDQTAEAQADGYVDGAGEYTDLGIQGLDFDATNFNAFNADFWSLLNYD